MLRKAAAFTPTLYPAGQLPIRVRSPLALGFRERAPASTMSRKRKTISEVLASESDCSESDDDSLSSEGPGSPLKSKMAGSIPGTPAYSKKQNGSHSSCTPNTLSYRTSGYTPGRTPGRNSSAVSRSQCRSIASTPSSTVHHISSSTTTPDARSTNAHVRDPESSNTGTPAGSSPEEVNILGSAPLHAPSTASTNEGEDSLDEPNSDSDTKSLLLTMIKRMDRHEKKLSNLAHKIEKPTSSSIPSGSCRRARSKNIPLAVRVSFFK